MMAFKDIRVWNKEKSGICKSISSHPSFLKVIVKTKNDNVLLARWINYYKNILPIEDIIVFDNMSDDTRMLDIYEEIFEKSTIVRYDGFHNFIHKVEIFPELYKALRSSAEYFLFVDTDEYIIWLISPDSFSSNEYIVKCIKDCGSLPVFPGTWLNNTVASDSVFVCGDTSKALDHGLRWGKAIISSSVDVEGIILHNTEINNSLYTPETPTNLFIMHLKELFPEERIKANVRKLQARRFANSDETIESLLNRDVLGQQDGMVSYYINEIRRLSEAVPNAGENLRSGQMRLIAGESIEYYSEIEKSIVANHLRRGRSGAVSRLWRG